MANEKESQNNSEFSQEAKEMAKRFAELFITQIFSEKQTKEVKNNELAAK